MLTAALAPGLDARIVGAKAANLGKAMEYGFRVPPGFVLTRQALDRAFACRVDIEWVVAADKVYLVQVRPITALPDFFPHHLSKDQAAKTWRQQEHWYFTFSYDPHAKVTPLLYRDFSLAELTDCCWPGLAKEQIRRYIIAEADFNGHRYCVNTEVAASLEKREAYLDQYEATIRDDFLTAKKQAWPAMLTRATELLNTTDPRSLKELIGAFFWVRDAFADIDCVSAGPAQSFWGTTLELLRRFMARYLPDYEAEGLVQGYHPALEPYYPHAQMGKAIELARTIDAGPVRRAFETLEPADLFVHLFEEHMDCPFLVAFEAYCARFGLYMPDHRTTSGAGERHRDAIGLVQQVLRGPAVDMAAVHARAMRQRQVYADELRKQLAAHAPEVLPRFETLYDWALFWGSALNDRGWVGLARQRCYELWWLIRAAVVEVGLVQETSDFIYFTAEDLAYLAVVDDVEEGRRIWQRRRLEHERYARLRPPEFLGAAPVVAKSVSKDAQPGLAADSTDSATRIIGKRCVPGRCSGTAFKIAAFAAAGEAGPEDILVLTEPVQPNASKTPLLIAVLLRVRGLVIVDGPMMWTHHVGQIARECGVPIVQIRVQDMEKITAGAALELDGGEGTVDIL